MGRPIKIVEISINGVVSAEDMKYEDFYEKFIQFMDDNNYSFGGTTGLYNEDDEGSLSMEYKGYKGTIEYSPNDRLYFGKLLSITHLVSYEATPGEDLTKMFREAVDDYVKTRQELNKEVF